MGILGKRWSVLESEKSRIKQGKKESKCVISGEVKSQLNPTGNSKMWISLLLAEGCLKRKTQPIHISRWCRSWKPKAIFSANRGSYEPIQPTLTAAWIKGPIQVKGTCVGTNPDGKNDRNIKAIFKKL